jgi:hypothetical protein
MDSQTSNRGVSKAEEEGYETKSGDGQIACLSLPIA